MEDTSTLGTSFRMLDAGIREDDPVEDDFMSSLASSESDVHAALVDPPASDVRSAVPPGFRPHVFERRFELDRRFEDVWGWLMRPETFTEGQVWPWRVEFLDTPRPDGSIARGFDVGTLNAHHGPGMNFCGRISRVEVEEDRATRDLDYDYGAYAIAFRLIRPTRLRLSAARLEGGRTEVIVRVESLVRSWMAGPWTFIQRCFWPSFGFWARRAVRPSGGPERSRTA